MFQILITSAGSLPSQICPTLQIPTDDDLRLRNRTIREGAPATAREAGACAVLRNVPQESVGDES